MTKFFPVQNGFEWLEHIDQEVEPPLPAQLFAPRKRAASFHIETKTSSDDDHGSVPVPVGRARTASDTVDYESMNDQNFVDLITTNISARMTEMMVELFARLLPPLRLRVFYFTVVLIILSLVIFGQASKSLSMKGVCPQGWYIFFLEVMGTDIATCIIDEFLFLLIDRFWLGAEEIRLYAHCLNGPLSFILTISIVNGGLSDQPVPQSIDSWNPMMSALISIWTLYTLRQFWHRMNLNKLMVTRFSSRIHGMQLDTKVLSILAQAIPQRKSIHSADSTPEHRTITPFESQPKKPFFPELPPLPEKGPLPHHGMDQSMSSQTTGSDESDPERQKAINNLRKTAFSKHFSNFIHKHREATTRTPSESSKQSLTEIFSEIVESSHRSGDVGTENDYGIQRSFWSRLAEVSNKSLVIETANGNLIIRNKKHAISFGKRLYTLLSRGGTKKITSARISDLIQRHAKEGDDTKDIIERAQTLFHLPPETDSDYDVTGLTQPMINDACISVYRSRRNIASSLSDFGELRKSLIAVTDVIFWIVMVIVAQVIVKVDLESVFAPVLTLIFAISFAVGPVVSNVFLAIGFVSFMLPFDVGDRVAIGTGPSRIVGNIERITLLQTTVTTLYNERLHLANHYLFSEKITNLQHSVKAVLEIPISFCLTGTRAVTKAQLESFWSTMKHYLLVEEKDKWIDVFIAGHTIDAVNNALGYSLWVTHRASFAQITLLYGSRTELIEKIYLTKQQLGIHFAKSIQPLERTEMDRDVKSDISSNNQNGMGEGITGGVLEALGIS